MEALKEVSAQAACGVLPIAEGKKRRAPRYGAASLSRRLAKLSFEAVDCLEQILADPSAKAADRVSAAKLTFDIVSRQSAAPDDGSDVVRVVFEGIPHEYAE